MTLPQFLTLWLALSVPFGVLVGRVIKGGAK